MTDTPDDTTDPQPQWWHVPVLPDSDEPIHVYDNFPRGDNPQWQTQMSDADDE